MMVVSYSTARIDESGEGSVESDAYLHKVVLALCFY